MTVEMAPVPAPVMIVIVEMAPVVTTMLGASPYHAFQRLIRQLPYVLLVYSLVLIM
jgi:hypothetical protein